MSKIIQIPRTNTPKVNIALHLVIFESLCIKGTFGTDDDYVWGEIPDDVPESYIDDVLSRWGWDIYIA
jgi:hypothetical protein